MIQPLVATCPPSLLPLTEADIETYWREGYVLIRGLVPTDAIDAAVAAWKQKHQDALDRNGAWSATTFDHQHPDRDHDLHRLLVHPRVLAAVEQLLEAPARIYYGMMAVVPPRGGRGLQWHQDNQYTQILGHALNSFIACCRIPPEKCNLWVSPRSHLKGLVESVTVEGHRHSADPGNGICLPTLEPGDACIFNRYTLHRSLTNATDEIRWAYAAQYQEDKARDATTSKRDPLRMRARDLAAYWSTLD